MKCAHREMFFDLAKAEKIVGKQISIILEMIRAALARVKYHENSSIENWVPRDWVSV